MPGLVSVKTPPETPPLRISVSETPTQAQAQTPTQQRFEPVNSVSNSKPASPLPRRPPSPSPSRSKFSPRKPPPDSPNSEAALDNPDLGPFLLKLARDTIASGEGPNKALDYALRASKSFELCSGGAEGEPSLDLAMTLYILAAISRRRFRFWSGPFRFRILREAPITRSRRFPVTCNSATLFRCLDRSHDVSVPTIF